MLMAMAILGLVACDSGETGRAPAEMAPLVTPAALPDTVADAGLPLDRCTITDVAARATAIVDPGMVSPVEGNQIEVADQAIVWERSTGTLVPATLSAATALIDDADANADTVLFVVGGADSATLLALIDPAFDAVRTRNECDDDLNASLDRVQVQLDGAPAVLAFAALADEIATDRPGPLQTAASWI